jgi:uncharacterized protein involved in exopolysaccharide biosynthesis
MSTKKPSQPIEPVWEIDDGSPAKTVVDPASSSALMRPQTPAEAHFVVVMGPNVGHKYPLYAVTTLGRSESADITLADDRVSGRHCEVVRGTLGFRIRDLGSSNGTLVNAAKATEAELKEGDLVQVGYTVFKFQLAPPAAGAGMPGMGMGGMGMGMGMGGMPGMGMGGMGMGMGGMPGMAMTPMSMPMAMAPMVPPMAMSTPQIVVTTGPAQQAAPPSEEMNLEEMIGNVRKVVDFFVPYKKMILAAGAVGLVLGFVLAIVTPPSVKATFEMNISTGGENGQGLATERVQQARSTWKSTKLLRMTLQALGEQPGEDRVAILQKLLNFETTTPNFGIPPPTMNFVGDYTSSTKEDAEGFLTAHIKSFITNEVEETTKQYATKLTFLTDEETKASAELKTSEESLKEFKQKYLASLPENVAKSQDQVFELEKTVGELTSGIEQLKLEMQSATTVSGPSKKQLEVKAINEQIAELKAQGGLGDNHPDVVALKKRLARVEAAEDTGPRMAGGANGKSTGQIRAEITAKSSQLEAVKKQLETVKTAQASMPEFEARYAELNRNHDAAKKKFEQLSAEKSQVEYQLKSERQLAETRFDVVVPPRAEKKSAGADYVKKVMIGVIGGIVMGFAIAGFLQILNIWKRR